MTREQMRSLIDQMREAGYEEGAKKIEEELAKSEEAAAKPWDELSFDDFMTKVKEELNKIGFSKRMMEPVLADDTDFLRSSYKLYGEKELDGTPERVADVINFEYMQDEHFEDALELIESGDYEEAYTILLKECQPHFDIETSSCFNSNEAQYYLGMMYIKGLGIERNYEEGFKYLTDALEGPVIKDFSIIFDNIEQITDSEAGKKACREYIDAILGNENVKIDETVALKLKEVRGQI